MQARQLSGCQLDRVLAKVAVVEVSMKCLAATAKQRDNGLGFESKRFV